MKSILAAALLTLLAVPAFAQLGGSPGQTLGGINQGTFNNNSDTAGFNEQSFTPSLVAAGTTQATAALVVTRTTVITSCPANAGVQLPSVNRYAGILLINRSGASCLVYPSPGATVETAPGTVGALNAPATIATNTDTIFRPTSATSWVQ